MIDADDESGNWDDHSLEFWNIEIDLIRFPTARGVLYAKPTPATVKARIIFPRLEPTPLYTDVGTRVKLTALCANRRWMRGIVAEVKDMRRKDGGDLKMELLLHRKSACPGSG